MGKGGGSPPPAPTQTQVVRSEIPAFFRPFLEDVFQRTSAISKEEYIPPPERGRLQEVGEETLAPIDPAQQEALDRLKSTEMAETGVSAVRAGQGLALRGSDLATSGAQRIGGEEITEAMNPFQQAVTDIAVREELRRAGPQRQAIQAQAARAGAFGGSRGALLEAEFERNLGQRLSDIQTTGGAAAFDRATQRLEQERQRQVGAGQAVSGIGGQLAGLGAQEAGVLSAGVGRQLSAGEAQRGLQTEAIGRGLEEFQREVDYPKQQIGFYSGILRGYQPPMNTYQTTAAPFSPTQQILGQAAAAGAIGKGFGLFNDGGIVGLAFGGAPSQQYTESVGDDKGLSSMVGNPVASYSNGGVGSYQSDAARRRAALRNIGLTPREQEVFALDADPLSGMEQEISEDTLRPDIRKGIRTLNEYITAPSVSFSPEADPLSEMESYADYGLPKINIPLSNPEASREERINLEKRVKGVVNKRVEDLLRVSAEQDRPLTLKQAQAQALEDVYGGERLGSEMADRAGKTGNQLIATGQVLAQESNIAREELEVENKAARAKKVTELAKKYEEQGFDPGSAIQAAQAEVSTDTTPTRKQIAERIGTGKPGVAPTRGTGTGSKTTEEGPLLADDEVVGGFNRLPIEEAKPAAADAPPAAAEPKKAEDLTDWFGLASAALAASTGREEGLTNAAKLLSQVRRPEDIELARATARYRDVTGQAGLIDSISKSTKSKTAQRQLLLDIAKFRNDVLTKDRELAIKSYEKMPDMAKQLLLKDLFGEDADVKNLSPEAIIDAQKSAYARFRTTGGAAAGGVMPDDLKDRYGITSIQRI